MTIFYFSTHRISSNISGFSRSLCFIRSFIAVIMLFALSSAPCFELFSAAPMNQKRRKKFVYIIHSPCFIYSRLWVCQKKKPWGKICSFIDLFDGDYLRKLVFIVYLYIIFKFSLRFPFIPLQSKQILLLYILNIFIKIRN